MATPFSVLTVPASARAHGQHQPCDEGDDAVLHDEVSQNG